MGLSEEQIQRYSRHILLPGVGGAGQERLLASSVLLAFSAAEENAALVALTYLSAAGVGRIGWCPLDEADEFKEKSPLTTFLGDSLEDGLRSLNPDSRLVSYRPGEEVGEDFDALVWLGDESTGDYEALKSTGKFVIRGASRDEAGEIFEGPGVFGKPGVSPHDGESSTVAAQGALGAWLAARVLRYLVDGMDTVGSTSQARFDLSHGFIEARANLS